MSFDTLPAIHVALSFAGLGTGIVVVWRSLRGRHENAWTPWFLATNALTSITGLSINPTHVGPAHVLAIVALASIALALLAHYWGRVLGLWRFAYAAGALFALYINVFAALVAAFQYIPALERLAPTLYRPPLTWTQLASAFTRSGFSATQLIVVAIFIGVAIHYSRRLNAADL